MSLRRFVGFSSCHAHTLRLQKSYCDLNRGTLLSRNPPVDTAPINVLFFFFFYPVADRESYSQRNNLTTTFLHHRRRQRRPEYHTTTLLVSPSLPINPLLCCQPGCYSWQRVRYPESSFSLSFSLVLTLTFPFMFRTKNSGYCIPICSSESKVFF